VQHTAHVTCLYAKNCYSYYNSYYKNKHMKEIVSACPSSLSKLKTSKLSHYMNPKPNLNLISNPTPITNL